VVDLRKAFDLIYNRDPDTDAVVANLSNRKQARVLLRDPALRREAAEAILSERQTRDAICLHFMRILEDPANWIGKLPADVEIYVGTIEPSGKVKH
jgi:hypothetical protein